ncbi:MAG: DUF881 domain-containing protein [Clostridia bacterium]|nr:DUF881 domain-containing protein [Clostridia bacterium]
MLKNWQSSLTVAFVALGILLSVQFHTQQAALKELSSQGQEDLIKVLTAVTEKRNDLYMEKTKLEIQKSALDGASNQEQQLVKSMENDLALFEAFYGLKPLKGPGIVITVPEQQYLFNSNQLVDIINELWNIGAEAVAVNDYRITYYTSIERDPETWEPVINGTRLSYPYVITAIGDPQKLAVNIKIIGGTLQLMMYDYKMRIDIEQKTDLLVPIAREKTTFRMAKPVLNSQKP